MLASILIVSIGGGIALADTLPVQTASAGTSEAGPGSQHLICRSRPEFGSRIPTRVCKTEEEWRIDDRHREAARRQYHYVSRPGCGTNEC